MSSPRAAAYNAIFEYLRENKAISVHTAIKIARGFGASVKMAKDILRQLEEIDKVVVYAGCDIYIYLPFKEEVDRIKASSSEEERAKAEEMIYKVIEAEACKSGVSRSRCSTAIGILSRERVREVISRCAYRDY
ncbi:MAG: hypothetical protein QXE01_03915 [Sulfolobales archaeon]